MTPDPRGWSYIAGRYMEAHGDPPADHQVWDLGVEIGFFRRVPDGDGLEYHRAAIEAWADDA